MSPGPNAKQVLRRAFNEAENSLNVTGAAGGGGISPSTSTKITNLDLPVADTEVSFALTTNVKQFLVRSRELAELKLSFTIGESGVKYVSVVEGAVWFIKDIDFTGESIYLQSPTANIVVEIVETF